MCGIAGWFSRQVSASRLDHVARMVEVQRHRGPDDAGVEVVSSDPLVTLGQARLSIIDVTPDGHQPMADANTGNRIVFNGEIYNFKQLRAEIESSGLRFHTQSDTEVLLKAYALWGEKCCVRLRGIFAFAIWDAKRKRLFIARDQMGVKPFYYCRSLGDFIFASEVRALLAAEAVTPHLDRGGLNSYLAYGSVQEPFTLIQGIRSLPAGHYAFVTGKDVRMTRYWSAVNAYDDNAYSSPQSKHDAYSEVASVLKESVALQMVSDVALGAFLSGGIDSSAIVSLMRQTHTGPIKTFSIVFDKPKFDERQYAKAVARQNGTDHVELELTGDLARAHLGKALSAFDQPSLDGLNTWFVSKLVHEAGLTVALSGVGGDELFVGYGGFSKPLAMMRWQKGIGPLPLGVGHFIVRRARSERLRKLGQLMGYQLPAYFLSRQLFSVDQTASLLKADYQSAFSTWSSEAFGHLIDDATELDEVGKISLYEMGSYMLSTLLRDTDQMSMAHGLEVRVPLIDHRVVETVLRLPRQWKMDAAVPKPILVHAAGDGLPACCVNRPKQGFVLPFEEWFKGSMKQDVESFCLGSASPVFDAKSLAALWRDYQNRYISWSRVWSLFVLNNWLIEHKIN